MTTNRGSSRALAIVCMLAAISGSSAHGRDEHELRIGIEIGEAAVLTRASHTSIQVAVSLPAETNDMPLMLTPHIDGDAIELVRGRLLRSDAKKSPDGRLLFAVPVVARAQGTALLRVDVMTYACSERCRRLDASSTYALHVR